MEVTCCLQTLRLSKIVSQLVILLLVVLLLPTSQDRAI